MSEGLASSGTRGEAPLLGALALVSAAVTAQQIALMQVLGWMHWHHFAYLIVAIALLGFGIAGTVLSLGRERWLRRWRTAFAWLLLGVAVSIPLGVRLAQHEALAVDLPLVFFAPRNVWRLVALCALLLPPFFCGGLATGLVLTANAWRAGRYYAASLAGAGAGGLAGVLLVAFVSPPQLPAGVAFLALLATLCLWRELSRGARVSAGVALALVVGSWLNPGELTSSQFKPLRRTLALPDAEIIAERTSVHGWVQVVAAPALRPTPAVSVQFTGEFPVQPVVFVNGVPYGSLLGRDAVQSPQWLEATTDAVAFTATAPRRVALLENGPAGWAALAARHGAQHIAVVERNGALISLLRGDGSAWSASPASTPRQNPAEPGYLAPEWRLPAVTIEHTTARTFLRRSSEAFDLIRFPDVGALGGTAGLGAASEQFHLTREAFADAWHQLTLRGAIAVTAWMDFPERNVLRLLATLVEMLESQGARPRAHLLAVRGWATVTFLIGREPWSAADAERVRAFCGEHGFDPLVLPGLDPAERDAHHIWQNPAFFTWVDQLIDGPREPLYRDYPFLIEPTTDQRPYFSQFLRGAKWAELRDVFGARTMPFFELGSLIVALAFALLAVLAAVCIVLPLFRLGWRAPGKASVLLTFGGLGAGFMLVEIGAMLQAHAWLGSPVLAGAVVITTLLVASGIGSLASEWLLAGARVHRRVLVLVAVAVGGAGAFLTLLAPLARSWPGAAQGALLVLIIAAVGIVMGMPFPLGLRRIAAATPAHVPWAWAINGCVSVATPAGAMLLAMQHGFGALFIGGAAAYLLAALGSALSVGAARTPA